MTLREYLKTKNLRPGEFAQQLGVSRTTLWRLERDGRVSVDLHRRIYDLTGGLVSPNDTMLTRQE